MSTPLDYRRFEGNVMAMGYAVECAYVMREDPQRVRLMELTHLPTATHIVLDMSAAKVDTEDVPVELVATLVRVPSAKVKQFVDTETGDPKAEPGGLESLRASISGDSLLAPATVHSAAFLGNFVVALNNIVGDSDASMSLYARNSSALAMAVPVPGADAGRVQLAIARFAVDATSPSPLPDDSLAHCGILADVRWFYRNIASFGSLADALLDAAFGAMLDSIREHVRQTVESYDTLLPFFRFMERDGLGTVDALRAARRHAVADAADSAAAAAALDAWRAQEHALVFAAEELARSTPTYARAPGFAVLFADLCRRAI